MGGRTNIGPFYDSAEDSGITRKSDGRTTRLPV
jgi:hypothetical protein